MERSIAGRLETTPSARNARPPASTPAATCGQPPLRRVQSSRNPAPAANEAGTGGAQANPLSSVLRQGLAVTRARRLDSVAPPASWTRALGCCHAPQYISAEPRAPAAWVQTSPTSLAPRSTTSRAWRASPM